MRKACSYCGQIHDLGYKCPKKPIRIHKNYIQKRESKEDKFRSSYKWKKKRMYILKRDRYLCIACLNGLHGMTSRLTTSGLSVHHIVPLKVNFDLRLDDSNLITLCQKHHELAESGKITAESLIKITPLRIPSDFSDKTSI